MRAEHLSKDALTVYEQNCCPKPDSRLDNSPLLTEPEGLLPSSGKITSELCP
jgi:hypothetical protein